MKQKDTFKEQYSPLWKTAGYLSSIIAILFFIVFLMTTDPLWRGIFRFVAFIGFVGAVFSYLRLREGQKKVEIEFLDKQLLLTYFKKNEKVKEEIFERKTIKEIHKKKIKPLNGLSSLKKGYEFFISFTDTNNKIPLFEYSGRHLRFSHQSMTEIDRFINQRLKEKTDSTNEHRSSSGE